MNWFSKKKWYIVTWKSESSVTATYTDVVKATCCAQAAHKVIKKNYDRIFVVRVEEVEE